MTGLKSLKVLFRIGPMNCCRCRESIDVITNSIDNEIYSKQIFGGHTLHSRKILSSSLDLGGFSTSVELTIRVSDVNDNAPKFELPDYQAHNIDEDIPIGTSILKVKASDADSGSNADIAYSVSDDHFAVDSDGLITNNRRLDADSNNAYYEFQVTAKDKGEPSRTGTATVRIYTENKNDEEPRFSQQVYTPNVDENAGPNTLVTTVVASDKVT